MSMADSHDKDNVPQYKVRKPGKSKKKTKEDEDRKFALQLYRAEQLRSTRVTRSNIHADTNNEDKVYSLSNGKAINKDEILLMARNSSLPENTLTYAFSK